MLTPDKLEAPLPPCTIGGQVYAVRPLTMRGFAAFRAFQAASVANDEDAAQAALVAAAKHAVPDAGDAVLDCTPAYLLAILAVATGRADEMLAALEAQAGNAQGAPAAASIPTPSAP